MRFQRQLGLDDLLGVGPALLGLGRSGQGGQGLQTALTQRGSGGIQPLRGLSQFVGQAQAQQQFTGLRGIQRFDLHLGIECQRRVPDDPVDTGLLLQPQQALAQVGTRARQIGVGPQQGCQRRTRLDGRMGGQGHINAQIDIPRPLFGRAVQHAMGRQEKTYQKNPALAGLKMPVFDGRAAVGRGLGAREGGEEGVGLAEEKLQAGDGARRELIRHDARVRRSGDEDGGDRRRREREVGFDGHRVTAESEGR